MTGAIDPTAPLPPPSPAPPEPADAAAAFDALLDHTGRPLELAAGAGFRLDDPETLWFVRAGAVDVFAAELRDGAATGPRVHLGTIPAGGVLCGIAEGHGLHLIAVGWEAARLVRLDAAALVEATSRAEAVAPLAAALDPWLAALGQGVARVLGAPVLPTAWVGAGETAAAKDGDLLAARKGVVWVEPEAGALDLFGLLEVTPDDPTPAALPPAAWAQVRGAQKLQGLSTAHRLRDGQWLALLAETHGRFLACLAEGFRRAGAAETERLQARAERLEHDRRRTFARFAALLSERLQPTEHVADEDALWECCTRVAETLGQKVEPRPEAGPGRAANRPRGVAAIARRLRVRTRPVALRGDWWRHDAGPLVAFVAGTGRPVALLPGGPHRYLAHDPVAGTAVPVDEALAETLAPMAYGFYPSLPDRAVGLWDILRFGLARSGGDLAWVIGVGALGSLLGLATPMAIGYVFATVIPGHERSQLLQVGLGLVAVGVVMAVLRLTGDLALLRVEGRIAGALQAAVLDRLLRLPNTFFSGYSAGDLANRTLMVESVRRAVTGMVVSSLLGGVFSLFSFALLLWYAPAAALIAAALVVLLMAAAVWTGWHQLRAILEGEALTGSIYSLVLQIVTGITKLRLAGAEDRAFVRWGRTYAEMRRRTVRARGVSNLFAAFTSGYEVLCLAAVFLVIALSGQSQGAGAGAEAAEPISTGAFLAFLAAFTSFLESANQLARATVQVFAVVPMVQRGRPILAALPESAGAAKDPGRLSGAVEATNLTFRYAPDQPRVLGGLSLQARAGEFVAIVGPSGCGKSTLVKLLLGFEKPEAGGIFYDGQDLRGLDLQEVRRQIGVVLQNGRLMPGTLYENIKGATDATVDDAWEAARTAGIADDIQAMPMGMHTVLTEGTAALSGGQIQRLLIARAVVGRPRLLLLDEATSALDNRTQKVVVDSLDRLSVTRIVIAHRVSTIVNADRIYVLRGGRVVEVGSYEQLMAKNGVFVDLARRQLI